MDRRTLLKLLAAAPLFAGVQGKAEGRGLQVVVAGAGIVGASIAYHLANSGAAVTVIDREGPATHASRGTFAWINATWAKQPRSYHTLSQQSVAQWRVLGNSLKLPVRWHGSLEWFDNPERQHKLVAQISEQADWGEAARMVDSKELADLEPSVDFKGAQQAALSGNDGTVDPVLATQMLLDAAKALGASVSYPCELTGVSVSRQRLVAVETSRGAVPADRLVLATGAAPDAAKTFAGIDIPQRTTPGVIAISAPLPRILQGIISAPGIHMHQRDDGRIVLGEQSGAPKNEAHALRLQGRPNQFPTPEIAQEHAGRMLAIAEQFAPGIANASIEDVYIGWRPLPIDGHPVLGASPRLPDVYLALMHSGVSLAPIVGQLAAIELTSAEAVKQLSPYRPTRKFKTVRRY